MAAPAASSVCRLLAGQAHLPCDCCLLTTAWPTLQIGNPMQPMVLLTGHSLPNAASSGCRGLLSHSLATALLLLLPKQQSHDGFYAACTQLRCMRCLQMYMLMFCVILISRPSACHVLLCALVTAPPAHDRQALYYKSALQFLKLLQVWPELYPLYLDFVLLRITGRTVEVISWPWCHRWPKKNRSPYGSSCIV